MRATFQTSRTRFAGMLTWECPNCKHPQRSRLGPQAGPGLLCDKCGRAWSWATAFLPRRERLTAKKQHPRIEPKDLLVTDWIPEAVEAERRRLQEWEEVNQEELDALRYEAIAESLGTAGEARRDAGVLDG